MIRIQGHTLIVRERRTWRLTPPDAALQAFLAHLPRVKPKIQTIPATAAYDRILAENLISNRSVPPLPRAAVDGYAVMSKATVEASPSHPVLMEVVGQIILGADNGSVNVGPGETVYIACGASLPPADDAVVKLEEVRYVDGMIGIIRPVFQGENVDQPGQDLQIGDQVLCSGQSLRAQDVAMLVALAKRKVKVVRRPRVAIIPVGSELVNVGDERPNWAIEKNSFIVSSLLRELYCMPQRFEPVQDDVTMIVGAISHAVRTADVVITMGGCSVGVRDLVPEAVNSLNPLDLVVHGVSVFPGKPTGLAVVNGKPLILLPGRVTSALAGFYLFVIPILSRLVGTDLMSTLPVVKARAGSTIRTKGGSSRFEILRIKKSLSGYDAEPLPKGVDILSNLLKSNGYIVIPPGTQVHEGQEIQVHLFSPQEMMHIQS